MRLISHDPISSIQFLRRMVHYSHSLLSYHYGWFITLISISTSDVLQIKILNILLKKRACVQKNQKLQTSLLELKSKSMPTYINYNILVLNISQYYHVILPFIVTI